MYDIHTPTVAVFAVLSLAGGAVGVFYFCKAITQGVARVWFAEKEKHAKRIIEMSKED